MGNESSLLVKGGGVGGIFSGHGQHRHGCQERRMSKAQSSNLVSELAPPANRKIGGQQHRNRLEAENDERKPLASTSSTGSETESGMGGGAGAYIKRREQQQTRRKQSALVTAAATATEGHVEVVPPKGGGRPEGWAASQGMLGTRQSSSSSDADEPDHDDQQRQQPLWAGKRNAEHDGREPPGIGGAEMSPEEGEEEPLSPLSEPSGSGLPSSKHYHCHFPHLTMASARGWIVKHRKEKEESAGFPHPPTTVFDLHSSGNNFQQKRNRSASLCAAQMKAECQAIAAISYHHALNGGGTAALGGGSGLGTSGGIAGFSRKHSTSQGVMPPLTRLRIQQGFRNAKPAIGHHILKRASTLRSDFKSFLNHLREEKVDELAKDIYKLVTECVANIELPSKVAATSFAFGELHVQLCNFGFRPDFFSVIADATIAECVRLDGGTQKRCEALMAWSQLMQFMFSNVRDGYYAEVRQQRRCSLPQQRLLMKQTSMAKQQAGLENGNANMENCSTRSNSKDAGGNESRKRMDMGVLQQGISFDMNI